MIKLHFESGKLKCVCRSISKKMSFKMKNSIYFYRLFDFDRKRRKGPPNADDRPEFILETNVDKFFCKHLKKIQVFLFHFQSHFSFII